MTQRHDQGSLSAASRLAADAVPLGRTRKTERAATRAAAPCSRSTTEPNVAGCTTAEEVRLEHRRTPAEGSSCIRAHECALGAVGTAVVLPLEES